MKNTVLALFMAFMISSLSAQVRIDSAFAFGPDTAKKYSIYIPSNYSSSSPNALMVGFHPYNPLRWNASSWCDTLLAFAEINDLILVCPDGDSLGIITDSLDYAFTTALIDSIKNWFSIDEKRIYAIGFSVGGQAVYEYGLNHADIFGGFIPIGAAINGTSFVSNVIQNAGRRPFYLVHGANDFPSQGFYPILNALKANCAFVDSILMPGVGHTIDFPNRNMILTTAYNWIDSVNMTPISASFSLNSPINLSTLTSKGFSDYVHDFNWGKSPVSDSCGVLKYEFMVDIPNGNFSSPLIQQNSNNGGIDTVMSFTNRQLDSLLAAYSIPLNGSLAVDWTVRSNINNRYSDTAKSYRIIITRKNLGFNISTPSNNNVVTLQNGMNKFFDWEDMNHYITVHYQLLFDSLLSDFSNPMLNYESSTGGTSSSLSISHEQLYYDLMFLDNKKIGDTVKVKWRALATETSLSELSGNEREITFIRGNVGFELFAPIDNSLINSKKDVSYSFSWDSVLLADIKYEWLFDTLGQDLHDSASFIFNSDVNGSNSRIEIGFKELDSMMNFYGVNYLDTLFGQWTSRVKAIGVEEYSLNTYKVAIVRAHPVGIEEKLKSSSIEVYPNPANQYVILEFDSKDNWQKVELIDNLSALVMERSVIGQNKMIINVENLVPGSYILKFSKTNQSRNQHLIIAR